jgi:hypothetical protein
LAERDEFEIDVFGDLRLDRLSLGNGGPRAEVIRHAGGKIFLDARPGHYEVMRRVLGHRSIVTTTSSTYTGAETRSAGLHFASVIAERRRALENQRSTKERGKRPGGNS